MICKVTMLVNGTEWLTLFCKMKTPRTTRTCLQDCSEYVYFGHTATTNHLDHVRDTALMLVHWLVTVRAKSQYVRNTNACNKQSEECYVSYRHMHRAIDISCVLTTPRGHNFGPVQQSRRNRARKCSVFWVARVRPHTGQIRFTPRAV